MSKTDKYIYIALLGIVAYFGISIYKGLKDEKQN
jgi:hypothetical protein